MTWRAVIVTQSLGAFFAVTSWLEWNRRANPGLPFRLTEQGLTAAFVTLAAFAGDEAVRRGWPVFRAFVAVLLCASTATVLAQWSVNHGFNMADPFNDLERGLTTFFSVGGLWGTVLLVYLNRQSAARLLAHVRAGELGRVQTERRLIASHLTATEAQIDPASLSQELAQVRDLYAAGEPGADDKLENLIANLRDTVAQCARVQAETSAASRSPDVQEGSRP